MIDVYDIFAFVVFAVLLVTVVVVVVALGSLPGWVARKRGHPQAAAVNVASWLGLAALGLLWPLALVWAFFEPRRAPAAEGAGRGWECRGFEGTTRTDAGARLVPGGSIARTSGHEGGALTIAFLTPVYTGLVVLLFKLKILRPRPFPIARVVVAGLLLMGGIVVAWMLCAPLSPRLVTTQYVVQLVPYVKGQVKKVHAEANRPVKKGGLLLEINPAPYQFKGVA